MIEHTEYELAMSYLLDQEYLLDSQGFAINPEWTEQEVIAIAKQMGFECK